MDIKEIKPNPSNPRVIDDEAFKKLKDSIEEFPKMMRLRPMVINNDGIVLGGNMRLKALQELGYQQIPDDWVANAEDLTQEEQRRFIIADNIGFGQWDFELLEQEWDSENLSNWGLQLWEPEEEVDYSALSGDEDVEKEVEGMGGEAKKAIQIEFSPEDYDKAQELLQYWRERDADVGAMIVEKLKEEKDED